MPSLVVGVRNVARRWVGRYLLGEPRPNVVGLITLGYFGVLIGCVALAFLVFDGQHYLLTALIPLLIGLSLLVKSAGDLAFEKNRSLAVRLRALAGFTLVLAYVALLAQTRYVFF